MRISCSDEVCLAFCSACCSAEDVLAETFLSCARFSSFHLKRASCCVLGNILSLYSGLVYGNRFENGGIELTYVQTLIVFFLKDFERSDPAVSFEYQIIVLP